MDLSASPVRYVRMPRQPKTRPCIQQQLKCHVAAREAALRGMDLAEKGKRRLALKAQAEMERWYRLYRKYGGTRPLT